MAGGGMTLFVQMRSVGRIIRRVQIELGEPPVVTNLADQPTFQLGLKAPREALPSDENSPRTSPRYRLRWAEGYRGVPGLPLLAGDRVLADDDVELELLQHPKALHSGRRIIGWEVEAQDIDMLYPIQASLHGQNDAVLAAVMPCAIWGGSDRREATGEYEERDSEAPVEFASLFETNTYVLIGSTKHRLISAVTDHVGPRVKLTLRSPQ